MRIHFLGTASGLPTAQRFSQTTVIEHRGGLHLLDVADGASALMLRQGLRHDAVRSITISHMHGDHHSGLIQLLKTAMHLGRRAPLRIFLPSEAVERYPKFLEMCYLVPEWMGFPIEWLPIEVEEELGLGDGLAMRTYANRHLSQVELRAKSLPQTPPTWHFQSYSFLMHKAPYTVAYTGNLSGTLKEMIPWTMGADVLISEFAHLGPEECIETLGILRPAVALFAHVGPKWDHGCPPLERCAVPGVQLFLAEDGDIFDLDELVDRAGRLNDAVTQ